MTLNGAIKQLHDLGCAEDMPIYYKPIFAGVIDVLRRDVQEVRHGRWIQNDNNTYSCSLCQSWIPEEQHHYARYCLYCGAKMKGVGKE